MARMNSKELEHFLTTHGLCRLVCLEADGSPYIVPLGYIYSSGGLFIRGRARATWTQYLQRDPRVCLMVEDDDGPRAQLQGTVELIEGPVTQAQSHISRLWGRRNRRWPMDAKPRPTLLGNPILDFLVYAGGVS